MKTVLIFPQWTKAYGIFARFARGQSGRPPLGLAYLAAVAEREGHIVRIIDAQAEGLHPAQAAEAALDHWPDIIGITATSPFFHEAITIAREIKQRATIPIAIGGTHLTVLGEQAFDTAFDYGFVGEADVSWPRFLSRLERNEPFRDVKGVLYRNGQGAIVYTGPPDPVEIRNLPFPARHLLKNEQYVTGTPRGRTNFANIMGTRGCPYGCVYCANNLMGKRVRKRHPAHVGEEMERVVRDYGITHFLFEDDNLTIDEGWIVSLCDYIDRKHLDVTWEGCTRADLINTDLVGRMKASGLVRLMLGLESADPKVRGIIHKGVSLDIHEQANLICEQWGVEVFNFAMLGLPGDTRRSIHRTIDYVKNNRAIKEVSFSIAVPYPGTQMLDMAQRGEHGLELVERDFAKYLRYGKAVMKVNGIPPKELVRLQNYGLAVINLKPWRWKATVRKMGFMGFALQLWRSVSRLGDIIYWR